MPMYEYECGGCGRRFEQLQRITEDPLATDPECGGPVRRVIQPVGIIFKGSGFYVTDSRNSSSSASTSKSSDSKTETKTETTSDASSPKSESSSSSSTESKPAAATAAA